MVQYEINDGSIRILYGSDEMIGVFLTVIDRRLEWKRDASDEANKVVEAISGSGGGHYLSLNTCKFGIGKTVSRTTMADFMGRYGVPKARIDEMLALYNPCLECKKATKLRCSKCKWKFYCSKECHEANWPRHKHFCNIKVLPEKRVKETSSQKSVYGVLLPEKEAKPKFVEVTLNLENLNGDPYWSAKTDEYIQDPYSSPRQWGSGMGIRTGDNIMLGRDILVHRPTHMEHTLQFYYRDTFQFDGSELNECVGKITDGKAAQAHAWAGPMLVMKVEENYSMSGNDTYMDMKLEDCEDMIDFFLLYGK